MRRKNAFLFLVLAIGIAILVPAIKYGKASVQTAEPEIEIPQISTVLLPISVPTPAETDVPSETNPSVEKKTEKPNATVSKKTQTKTPTPKKVAQKPVKKEVTRKLASASTPKEVTESPKPSVSVPVDIPPTPAIVAPAPAKASCDISGFNQKFLCLINAHRVANNRRALAYDGRLSSTARLHSEWMNDTGITSHTGENGSKFYERCEASGTGCLAENIAMGFTSASHLFELWKDSPGHNANMLGNYSVIGLGIYGEHATTLFR